MSHYRQAAYAVIVAALGYGIYASTDAGGPVYADPSGWTISRRLDDAGHDRVYLDVEVTKLRSCDLESGRGPVWVDFSDPDDLGVPPPSPFFRPDGTQAGKTIGKAGDRYWMRGYSALVPAKMKDGDGTWSIRVPCQLWTLGDDGKRRWGRKITTSFGPLPLPKRGSTLTQVGKIEGVEIPLYDERDR